MTDEITVIERPQPDRQEIDTCFRFAVALIEEKGNATAAAKRVFRIGKKGGRPDNGDNVAAVMGWRMLRNVKTKECLARLTEASGAGAYDALRALAEIMNGSDDSDVKRKAAVDLLRYHGKYDRRSPSPQHHQNVHLVIPARPAKS